MHAVARLQYVVGSYSNWARGEPYSRSGNINCAVMQVGPDEVQWMAVACSSAHVGALCDLGPGRLSHARSDSPLPSVKSCNHYLRPKGHTVGLYMNCSDVTLKSIKSHLYHVVRFSLCDLFFFHFPFLLIIIFVFYALSRPISAVYRYVCYVFNQSFICLNKNKSKRFQ